MSPNKTVLKPQFDPIKFLELEHLEEKVKVNSYYNAFRTLAEEYPKEYGWLMDDMLTAP